MALKKCCLHAWSIPIGLYLRVRISRCRSHSDEAAFLFFFGMHDELGSVFPNLGSAGYGIAHRRQEQNPGGVFRRMEYLRSELQHCKFAAEPCRQQNYAPYLCLW